MVATAPHSDKPWTPECLLVVQGEKENKNKIQIRMEKIAYTN